MRNVDENGFTPNNFGLWHNIFSLSIPKQLTKAKSFVTLETVTYLPIAKAK
jgi:hypothetical protein